MALGAAAVAVGPDAVGPEALVGGAAEAGGGGLRSWLLYAEAVLAGGLAFSTYLLRHFRWHDRWLRRRAAAEALRGESWLFLARTGPYRDASDAIRTLRTRVAELRREGARRTLAARSGDADAGEGP